MKGRAVVTANTRAVFTANEGHSYCWSAIQGISCMGAFVLAKPASSFARSHLCNTSSGSQTILALALTLTSQRVCLGACTSRSKCLKKSGIASSVLHEKARCLPRRECPYRGAVVTAPAAGGAERAHSCMQARCLRPAGMAHILRIHLALWVEPV